jgi:opacity protein-like surface antigen
MASLGIRALAGAITFAGSVAVSGAAFAADMPYPAPPPVPPPLVEAGGWYLRGDIGFSNQEVDHLDNALYSTTINLSGVQKDFDAAPFGGLGVGYKFNQWLRMDVTGEYRAKADFHGLDTFQFDSGGGVIVDANDVYTASKSEWTGLLNAYVDLGTWSGITPFVGGGIGFTRNTISNFTDLGSNSIPTTSVAYGKDHSEWDLAWALQAGLAYEVAPGLTLEFAYRYLNLGDAESGDLIASNGVNTIDNPMKFEDLISQDFKFGMRWMIGAAAEPVQESAYPMVTKP